MGDTRVKKSPEEEAKRLNKTAYHTNHVVLLGETLRGGGKHV
jgi:hypothetical protein